LTRTQSLFPKTNPMATGGVHERLEKKTNQQKVERPKRGRRCRK